MLTRELILKSKDGDVYHIDLKELETHPDQTILTMLDYIHLMIDPDFTFELTVKREPKKDC